MGASPGGHHRQREERADGVLQRGGDRLAHEVSVNTPRRLSGSVCNNRLSAEKTPSSWDLEALQPVWPDGRACEARLSALASAQMATTLLANGCPIGHIRVLLGHMHLATTCRYYLGMMSDDPISSGPRAAPQGAGTHAPGSALEPGRVCCVGLRFYTVAMRAWWRRTRSRSMSAGARSSG
jgi:hypothetical protein